MEQNTVNTNQDMFAVASIFHYVLGGFQMLFSLLGVLYIVLGYLMSSGALESAKHNPPPEAMGWVFSGVGFIFTAIFLTMGILTIRTGLNLMKKRRRTFCMVIDAILCLMVPFGTIVGIFGLVLLMKPETEALFTG